MSARHAPGAMPSVMRRPTGLSVSRAHAAAHSVTHAGTSPRSAHAGTCKIWTRRRRRRAELLVGGVFRCCDCERSKIGARHETRKGRNERGYNAALVTKGRQRTVRDQQVRSGRPQGHFMPIPARHPTPPRTVLLLLLITVTEKLCPLSSVGDGVRSRLARQPDGQYHQ